VSDELPTLRELDDSDPDQLRAEFDRHAGDARHEYAALYLAEIRRRQSRDRERTMIVLTAIILALTIVGIFATIVVAVWVD
jgi:hypothetical protein